MTYSDTGAADNIVVLLHHGLVKAMRSAFGGRRDQRRAGVRDVYIDSGDLNWRRADLWSVGAP